MIEDVLRKIARQVMALDEDTLTSLLPRYKRRMQDFTPTQEWEEAMIIYFMINGLRIKNSQFRDKIKDHPAPPGGWGPSGPRLSVRRSSSPSRETALVEDVLRKIARQIMALNEETLSALLPRYKERMQDFAPTQEWEEAMVIYFLINGLRSKNSQFNDKIRDFLVTSENGGEKNGSRPRPRLRLVKAGQKKAEAREDGSGAGTPETDDSGD